MSERDEYAKDLFLRARGGTVAVVVVRSVAGLLWGSSFARREDAEREARLRHDARVYGRESLRELCRRP